MYDHSPSLACFDTSLGRFHITAPLLILAQTSVLKGTDFNHILKWDNCISHPRQTDQVKLQISNSYVERLGSCNCVVEDARFMGCDLMSLEV
jgi:hypothetical protein